MKRVDVVGGLVLLHLFGAVAGCKRIDMNLLGLPCKEHKCLPGYVCHPEKDICVVELDAACPSDIGLCPQDVVTGSECPSPGSFLPCLDGSSECDKGCRTCDEDLRWSECSPPLCVDGAVDLDHDPRNGCECNIEEEICDGVDNDCDGDVDEGLGVGTSCSGSGVCGAGLWECAADHSGTLCSTMPGGSQDASGVELCDGLDNDCDGQVDQVFQVGEACAVGGCTGIWACSADHTSHRCVGCDCSPAGATLPCDAGFGVSTGKETCRDDGSWSLCRSNWQKRLKLTFNNSGRGALVDFPVLVALSSTIVSECADASTHGKDLLFLDADGITVLDYEIDTWDPAASSSVWVRVPQINASSAVDFIWLYCDNTDITVDSPSSERPHEVWSPASHIGVWHLSEGADGRGTALLYHNSARDSLHGTDNVMSSDKTGVIGAGQGFGLGDTIVVGAASGLDLTYEVTLEAWVSLTDDYWRYRRKIDLSPATPEAGVQVELHLRSLGPTVFNYGPVQPDGSDLRFLTPSGVLADYWYEKWAKDNDSTVWIRVPSSGTSQLTLLYGNSQATVVQSDVAKVLDSGLWLTTWSSSSAITSPTTETLMDTEFSSPTLGYDRRAGWGQIPNINCSSLDGCNPYSAQQDNFWALFEGWVKIPSAGDWVFAVDSDDASDLFVNAADWRVPNAAALAASWYGAHGSAGSFLLSHAGSPASPVLALANSYYRFVYRYQESAVNEAYKVAMCPAPSPPGVCGLIESTNFRHRRRTEPEIAAGFAGSELEASFGVAKEGSYELKVNGLFPTPEINDQRLTPAARTVGWHYVVLVYDGGTMRLYVDGVAENVTAGVTAPLTVNGNNLVFGDLTPDAILNSGPLDEIRLSSVARSADWVSAQYAAMSQSFVTLGPVETTP